MTEPTDSYESPYYLGMPEGYEAGPLAGPRRRGFVVGVALAVLVAGGVVVAALTRDPEPSGVTTAPSPSPPTASVPAPSATLAEPVYTPSPPSPPPPVYPTVRISGTGNRTVAFSWPSPVALVFVRTTGGAVLQADQLDKDDFRVELLYASNNGVHVMEVDERTTKLAVRARGDWAIELRSVLSAPEGGPRMSGSGNAVYRFTSEDAIALLTTHADSEYQHDAAVYRVADGRVSQRLCTCGGDDRTDRKRWSGGEYLVWVRSHVPWTLTIE